jgi:hypothetical protein
MLEDMMIRQFFALGAKREMDELWPGPEIPSGRYRQVLNLGSGKNPISGATNLDRPGWEAPILPPEDGTVSAVHMHHFLEHLDPHTVLLQMSEVARVLMPRGVVYITVPHAGSQLAFQAYDHRTFWTEESMQDFFYSAGYDAQFGGELPLDIAFMMIMGREFRNLQLFVQLVKADEYGRRIKSRWKRET